MRKLLLLDALAITVLLTTLPTYVAAQGWQGGSCPGGS